MLLKAIGIFILIVLLEFGITKLMDKIDKKSEDSIND